MTAPKGNRSKNRKWKLCANEKDLLTENDGYWVYKAYKGAVRMWDMRRTEKGVHCGVFYKIFIKSIFLLN